MVEGAVRVDDDIPSVVVPFLYLSLQVLDPCLEGVSAFLGRVSVDCDTVAKDVEDPLPWSLQT